jgi:hypothetical protein
MAFTGTATIKQISDSMVRITGLSLASGATGTIALSAHTGATPDVVLPASFKTEHYAYLSSNVTFQDAIDCQVQAGAAAAAFQLPAVIKSGTTTADFRVTLNNAFASATPAMEIYVRFHQ